MPYGTDTAGRTSEAARTRRLAITVTALSLLLVSSLRAQDDADGGEKPPVRVGIVAGLAMNLHRGDFTSYDGILECGIFDKAETIGWSAGYRADIPFGSSLALSGRLFYWKADGDFTAPNPNVVRIAIDEQTVVPLETEHTLQTALDYVMLEIPLLWRPTPALYIGVGPSLGYAARAAYEQEERIVSPEGITFVNGTSSRDIIAGNFDEQGTLATSRILRIGAAGVLGADIPLSDRLSLLPEAGISYDLTGVLSSFDWKVHAVRGTLSLMYALGGERGRTDTFRMPPAAAPSPVIALDAFNVQDGAVLNYAEITVAEEGRIELLPMLPSVFFGANDAALAARYRRVTAMGTDDFSEETAGGAGGGLDVYYDLLNVIGSRLRRHPSATITITGCREPLDDSGSTDALSRARAEAVKSYLTQTWGIAPERIAVTTRILPEEPSNRTIVDGREENRRAEIRSDDPRILAPVQRRPTSQRTTPDVIALRPNVQFGESIASWEAEITTGDGTRLWQQSGRGAPDDRIDWDLGADAIARVLPGGVSSSTVTATLRVRTDSGDEVIAHRDLPARRLFSGRRYTGEIVRDSLVESYSLLFFDFDAPTLSDFGRPVLDLIRNRMRTSSTVEVTGLTDRIGDEAHNMELSRARAAETAEQIRTRIVPERITTRGVGESTLYTNDLPEGRMYNRTVIVEIATPVAEEMSESREAGQ